MPRCLTISGNRNSIQPPTCSPRIYPCKSMQSVSHAPDPPRYPALSPPDTCLPEHSRLLTPPCLFLHVFQLPCRYCHRVCVCVCMTVCLFNVPQQFSSPDIIYLRLPAASETTVHHFFFPATHVCVCVAKTSFRCLANAFVVVHKSCRVSTAGLSCAKWRNLARHAHPQHTRGTQ